MSEKEEALKKCEEVGDSSEEFDARQRVADFVKANPLQSMTAENIASHTNTTVGIVREALRRIGIEDLKVEDVTPEEQAIHNEVVARAHLQEQEDLKREAELWKIRNDLMSREKLIEEKEKAKEYLSSAKGGRYTPEDVASVLEISSNAVRLAMAELVSGTIHIGTPSSVPPAKAEFIPCGPKEIPSESIDATMERLSKVDDSPVKDYYKRTNPKTTVEALMGEAYSAVDPENYEWIPVDYNLEACWAGWDTVGFRLRGKRQLKLFMSVDALKRALGLSETNKDDGLVKARKFCRNLDLP